MSTQAVRRDLDNLLQVEQADFTKATLKMSIYENLKPKIRQATLALMEQSLSLEEGSALMYVVEQVEKTQANWLPVETLVEAICADRTKTSKNVKEALYSLIRKGYLSEGVTIPIWE